MATMAIHITGDAAADQVLTDSPFALLVGMMLDQQYPMEHAFRGPAKVLERFGTLEPARIAAADPEEFAALCATPPAIHRFPGSMSARLQELTKIIVVIDDQDLARLRHAPSLPPTDPGAMMPSRILPPSDTARRHPGAPPSNSLEDDSAPSSSAGGQCA